MRNKITAAGMALAAVLLLGGCSLTGNVLSPAPTDALPVVTVTLPGNDTAARPERTPAPGVDNAINSGTDYSSLDGVAEPGDVLPILTYDEARQQNRDVIGWMHRRKRHTRRRNFIPHRKVPPCASVMPKL